MKISTQLTDDGILRELGERLAGIRLGFNLTQAKLAERAGVGKRTVERLEGGEVATQFSVFLRVCRVLGLLDHLNALIPEPTPSPMAQLKWQGKMRRRASGKKTSSSDLAQWTWGKAK